MRPRDPAKEKAIRRTAMELVVRHGFDGLSMQKLAKAAGVSPATLYIYFKDREDLILQVYKEELQKSFEATLEGFDPGMSLAEGLRVQWTNSARYCLANPLAIKFMEQFRHTPLHNKAMTAPDTKNAALQADVRDFRTQAIARGELADMPLEIYWALSFAPMFQLVKHHLQEHDRSGPRRFVLTEDILLQTLELALKALAPSPGTNPKQRDATKREGGPRPAPRKTVTRKKAP